MIRAASQATIEFEWIDRRVKKCNACEFTVNGQFPA